MKILFAASEAVPYCKTGGLADVAGALPERLVAKGHSVALVLPLYRAIDRRKFMLEKISESLSIVLGDSQFPANIWRTPPQKKLQTYFIEANAYFDREGLYGPVPGSDHLDNDRRFSLFSRAILEMAKTLKFKPDVIHTHDWQTGLVSALLKTVYGKDEFFKNTASVFSIHNMAYQGHFEKKSFAVTGLPPSEFGLNGIEFYGKVNYLKGGLVYSDALTTVSPTYAKEIISRYEFGFGLEGLLRFRKDRLVGILNGLDMSIWNPQSDSHLAANFDHQSLKNRIICKSDLQKITGLERKSSLPVLGFVGRLDRQKGVHFLLEIAPHLLKQNLQMVFLGIGDRDLQHRLLQLQKKYRKKVFVETNFSEPMAHKIYAGCDLFLMPSLFEPCGLGQMIAMRYGALPVVTPTGGLLDTVKPYRLPSKGTGFVAKEVSASSVYEAIQEGLKEYSHSSKWQHTQKRNMKIDFSWEASLPAYMEQYEKARRWRKKTKSQ